MKRTSADRDFGIAPTGYRLPDATRLGCARLQVGDLARSVAYYRDVLGLRVIGADTSSAALGPKDAEDVLLELHERRGARAVPRSGVLGLFHFAILLPDRAALGRFIRHLLTLGLQFGSADHFVSEATYLWDPDGLGIEVYADRPRGAWRTHGRELVMTTETLDLRSLIDAAGTASWDGMPGGTTLGHMHLSVGDLSQARAFYHEGLGLEQVVWSYPGALFLSTGGYHHHLGTNTWAPSARPSTEDDAKLLEWELILPQQTDVEEAATSLRTRRLAPQAGLPNEGSDFVARDPWGTALRLRSQQ